MDIHEKSKGEGLQPRMLFVTTIAATLRAFLLPIAQHFREKGWRVDAMANGVASDAISQAVFNRVWNTQWSRNPILASNMMMTRDLRRIAIQEDYDIVHVHTPVAAFVTRFALEPVRQKNNLQVIYTAHGFHFHPVGGIVRNTLFGFLEQRAANWTDFLVVMNREDLKAAEQKHLVESDRLRFMPGIGVDRSRYSSSSVSEVEVQGLREELNLSVNTPVLLMVAEFTKRKHHADALRAFQRLADPKARLVCAGGGPLLESMRRLATGLGIGDRVHFLGIRHDVPVLMKAARALVLPSSQEGLPRCVMEALTMGIPVIGSRIRGTAELLERNAGLLVDVGAIDQLADAMRIVIEDGAAAMAMGQNGRIQSKAYDLRGILHMHEALYEEALELRRARNSKGSQRLISA